MIPPIEEHKHLSQVDNVKDLAHFTLFEKYIVQDLKGDDKKFEIESTDQEGLIASLTGGFPIPGMVYTFIYRGEQLVMEIASKKSEFFDHVPIVFCMNYGRDYLNGLNMNMLPPNARLSFLQSFYETFREFFDKIERLTENNKLAFNRKFVEFMKSGGGSKMIQTFNAKTKSKFEFAYRRYNFVHVKKFRMIEYAEWPYIPLYEPKNAFRGMNHAQIHKLYARA